MAGHERPRAFDTAGVRVGVERSEVPQNAVRDRKTPPTQDTHGFCRGEDTATAMPRRSGVPRLWSI